MKSARCVLEQLVEALSGECVQENIREGVDRGVHAERKNPCKARVQDKILDTNFDTNSSEKVVSVTPIRGH